MIKIGIVGATGYTGVELLRLLAIHPSAEIVVVTSNSEKGKKVTDIFPNMHSHIDLEFDDHQTDKLSSCDVVFFATPHATAMHYVPKLLDHGCRIIDLSADFRLTDPIKWQEWYKEKHTCPELLKEAVYGLPEFNRDKIKNANLVANPGCYPTAISLALLPAIQSGLIETGNIVADAKSGVSGAGRKASLATQYSEVSESFKAYSVSGHRHFPEIVQMLTDTGNKDINLTFVPHLVPMNRGMLATIYVNEIDGKTDINKHYIDYYKNEYFVDVMPERSHPETRTVKGTNYCRIAIHPAGPDNYMTVILSVIDNLGKGAAGQAIQNMNLMFNLDETAGLVSPGLIP